MRTVPHVFCIDVGGPAKIGWADDTGAVGSGLDLGAALDGLSGLLRQGRSVALGFEAPIWTPRRTDLTRITSRRGGIKATFNRAWSAGAGTDALAAALALMPWYFARIRQEAGDVAMTVDPARFRSGEATLFVWEAFVSGIGKGTSHHDDALLAVPTFIARWPGLSSDVPAEPALNHAVSSATAAGIRANLSELAMPAVVIGVTPETIGTTI